MKPYLKELVLVITCIVVFIAAYVTFIVILITSNDRREKVECYKWQKEAQELSGYYLLTWQEKQCQHHEIEVTAPVQ